MQPSRLNLNKQMQYENNLPSISTELLQRYPTAYLINSLRFVFERST
jgi:hypothetical protein